MLVRYSQKYKSFKFWYFNFRKMIRCRSVWCDKTNKHIEKIWRFYQLPSLILRKILLYKTSQEPRPWLCLSLESMCAQLAFASDLTAANLVWYSREDQGHPFAAIRFELSSLLRKGAYALRPQSKARTSSPVNVISKMKAENWLWGVDTETSLFGNPKPSAVGWSCL